MKPEFSKQFDLAHAAAGAPVGKVGGGTARFVAYAEEADPSCCVVVIEDRFNLIGTRRKSGRVNEVGATDNPNDLVMLPLGLIDGKPVFVGDELVRITTPNETPKAAGPVDRGPFTGWTWPAPAKVYPVTTMRHGDMFDTYSADLFSRGHASAEAHSSGLAAVANAALRHAVDAGQVVPKDEHEAALYRLGDQLKGVDLGARATRDIAIAEAVRTAALTCNPIARGYEASEDRSELWIRISSLDLPAIISTIK